MWTNMAVISQSYERASATPPKLGQTHTHTYMHTRVHLSAYREHSCHTCYFQSMNLCVFVVFVSPFPATLFDDTSRLAICFWRFYCSATSTHADCTYTVVRVCVCSCLSQRDFSALALIRFWHESVLLWNFFHAPQ